MKLLRKALDNMGWDDLALMVEVVEGLSGLSTIPAGTERVPTGHAETNREEAVGAATNLLSSFFDDKRRRNSLGKVVTLQEHGGTRDLFRRSFLQHLPCWVVYVEGLHKRHQAGDTIAPVPLFLEVILGLWGREDLRDTEDAIKFRRAVDSIPKDVLGMPEEETLWVKQSPTGLRPVLARIPETLGSERPAMEERPTDTA